MEDGLYFLGDAGWQWVAEVDYNLNKQANDLGKPDTLQMPYSSQFPLPNTLAIQRLLGNAEMIDAGGKHPYTMIPARIIENEEILIDGQAVLRSFRAGWQVSVYDPMKPLFDKLGEKKLRDLELSRFDHPWTLEQIEARAGTTEGIVYPIVDYGTLNEGILPQDTIFPAIFVSDLVSQALFEEGYKAVGNWLDDPMYKALIVPFTEEKPRSRDQKWVNDRMARVTLTDADILEVSGMLNRIQPFDVDDRPLENWVDGKANNYNPGTYQYTADTAMRLNVVACQWFVAKVNFGAVQVKLGIEVNGAEVKQKTWAKGGPYNQWREWTGLIRRDSVELSETVQLKKGDVVKIRLTVKKQTTFADYDVRLFQTSDTAYASFEPDVTIQTGDYWPVAPNLPEMTARDLIKAVAFKMSGWFDIDDRRKTIELVRLTDVTENRANAQDWSRYLEEASEPELQFQISPYAQRNLVKWKELEGNEKGYGDGVIRCDKSTLTTETTLFEMPFAATMPSTRQVTSYGAPLLIETRTFSGSGDKIQIQTKATTPRLILIEPSKTFSVPTQILNSSGDMVPATVTLTGCWFARREQPIVTEENGFSLAFDPVPGQLSEVSLIARYFTGLKRVLRRPRALNVSMILPSSEFITINPKIPVRLRSVRVGEVEITDTYFYLNKLENFHSGKTCTASLVAF